MSDSPQMHSDDPPAIHAGELPGPATGNNQKRWVFLGIAALGLALPLLLFAPFGLGLDFEVELLESQYVLRAYDVTEGHTTHYGGMPSPHHGFGTYHRGWGWYNGETAHTLRIGNRALEFAKAWVIGF